MDTRSIKRDLDRISAKGDFRLQTQTVQVLLTQVREYIEQIHEEKQITEQIYDLRRTANKPTSTPEEEQEQADAKQSLQQAEHIKRNLSAKLSVLRQLQNDVRQILSEINRVI